MVVHIENLSRDGIVYEVTVRDEVTGYYGAWFCKNCWRGGVKYELFPTITQAIEDATGRAKTHHSQSHNASSSNVVSGGAMRPFDIES
jgi:hypothetical protein